MVIIKVIKNVVLKRILFSNTKKYIIAIITLWTKYESYLNIYYNLCYLPNMDGLFPGILFLASLAVYRKMWAVRKDKCVPLF